MKTKYLIIFTSLLGKYPRYLQEHTIPRDFTSPTKTIICNTLPEAIQKCQEENKQHPDFFHFPLAVPDIESGT